MIVLDAAAGMVSATGVLAALERPPEEHEPAWSVRQVRLGISVTRGRTMNQLGWSVALLCVLAPVALAGETETQENPIYKHWAQFKPGTYVV